MFTYNHPTDGEISLLKRIGALDPALPPIPAKVVALGQAIPQMAPPIVQAPATGYMRPLVPPRTKSRTAFKCVAQAVGMQPQDLIIKLIRIGFAAVVVAAVMALSANAFGQTAASAPASSTSSSAVSDAQVAPVMPAILEPPMAAAPHVKVSTSAQGERAVKANPRINLEQVTRQPLQTPAVPPVLEVAVPTAKPQKNDAVGQTAAHDERVVNIAADKAVSKASGSNVHLIEVAILTTCLILAVLCLSQIYALVVLTKLRTAVRRSSEPPRSNVLSAGTQLPQPRRQHLNALVEPQKEQTALSTIRRGVVGAVPHCLLAGMATSKGHVRTRQEDGVALFRAGELIVAIVADGVGGEPNGHLAANAAIRSATSALRSAQVADMYAVERAFMAAVSGVMTCGTGLEGCRTTLLVAVVAPCGNIAYGFAGDGGMVHLRHDGAAVDVLQPHHDDAGHLTASLGPLGLTGQISLGMVKLAPGDSFLLGSDGVMDRGASRQELCTWLSAEAHRSRKGSNLSRGLQAALDLMLVQQDNAGNYLCDDNATVCVVSLQQAERTSVTQKTAMEVA